MKNAKAVVAAVGLVVTALSAALTDDVLSTPEVGNIVSTIVTAGLTVYAVWKVSNKPAPRA